VTSPVDIARQSLAQIGQQISISSFSDTSPAGKTAQLLYTPTVRSLLRAAPWGFARAQIALTLWKSATVNGAPSANPPPQPWLYSYEYPNDCLKLRYLRPTLPSTIVGVPLTTGGSVSQWLPQGISAMPFVDGTDFDGSDNFVRVVMTNVLQAQAIYVRDLSQFPDTWDPIFTAAVVAMLAAYFINALARNAAQMNQQIAMAKSMIEGARVANANEAITTMDHIPDWLQARAIGGMTRPWAFNDAGGGLGQTAAGETGLSGNWDGFNWNDGTLWG
jgi:hypothetical protein